MGKKAKDAQRFSIESACMRLTFEVVGGRFLTKDETDRSTANSTTISPTYASTSSKRALSTSCRYDGELTGWPGPRSFNWHSRPVNARRRGAAFPDGLNISFVHSGGDREWPKACQRLS